MDSIKEKVLETFKRYDADNNGQIEKEELLKVLQEVDGEFFGAKQVDEMLKSADMDGDGKISFDEFLDWIFKDELLVTHTTKHDDGVIVRKFVDGRTRTTFPDGAVIDEFTGGVRRQKNASGVMVITDDAKGSKTTIRPNGSVITSNKDGSKVQTDSQGRCITTSADGTRTQVDPDGVRIVTTKAGFSTTHLLDGTVVERFSEEQSGKNGMSTIQRGSEGSLLLTTADGGRVQFEPLTGITVCTSADEKTKLQRARDGSALVTKDGGKPEPLDADAVLAAIKEGTYPLPEEPGVAPVVEFSALATEEHKAEMAKVTAEAAEKAAEAAAAEVPMTPQVRPRAAAEDEAEPAPDSEGSASGSIISDEILKSGTRRTTFSDGRVVERHKNGTVIVVHLSGEKEQSDPDGTIITTYTDGRPTLQVNADGSRIMSKADGSHSTSLPDGTVIEVDVDKVKYQRSPDGTVIKTWPDGRKVQCTTDGVTIETLPDGAVRQCRADGSGMVRDASGRNEERHAAGYFKGDIDGVKEAGAAAAA
mmetsp:Transcript_122271/g.228388  ORF Transcript_122271/g.228388 Transcript_122271/m.228388 type:complete len:533 (+) Transcript_122271:42-1640(+)